MKKIRIGTRGSRLALIQARMAQAAMESAFAGIQTELVILHTKGDKILDKPLAEIGDKGLFVSEFEQAILQGEIDMAVHSAKDLPMQLAEGLTIGAVLPGADVRDVLVIKKNGRLPEEREKAGTEGDRGSQTENAVGGTAVRELTVEEVPGKDFVLGTGSQRRCVQAEHIWNNVTGRQIRGNVETRLKKLDDGGYDGLLLAKAGLDRLGIDESSHPQYSFFPLEPERFLPAACQGIVALEVREGGPVWELLRRLSDAETELFFRVERQVLALLQADCSEPAAAWCRRKGNGIALDVMYGGERTAGFCPVTAGEKPGNEEDGGVCRAALERQDTGAGEELFLTALRMAEGTVNALKGRKV